MRTIDGHQPNHILSIWLLSQNSFFFFFLFLICPKIFSSFVRRIWSFFFHSNTNRRRSHECIKSVGCVGAQSNIIIIRIKSINVGANWINRLSTFEMKCTKLTDTKTHKQSISNDFICFFFNKPLALESRGPET